MKILIFNWQDITNPFGGGAEVHLHQIFSRIAKLGNEVTLCCCEVEGRPNMETIDDIKIIRKGSRNTFNFSVPKLYKELTKLNKYDIVIDDINKIPFYLPLYSNLPTLALSHHFFGTSIFKEAGIVAGGYVYLSEALIPIIYKNTPLVVVSESTRDEFLAKGFAKDKIKIVYNAIAQENYPMQLGKKNDKYTITYFGRLKKYKSIEQMLIAYAQIAHECPESQISIIGRGDYQPQLEQIAKDLKIYDKVVFHGFVDDAKRNQLLAQSHLVVNTSIKEGWGITNIEANACGTPVICANSPGLRDSINDGKSGRLYKYGDTDQIAQILKHYYINRKELDIISQSSVEWASNFSWDKSAKQMLDICKTVVNKAF